eukprot:scaffold232925_cov53-Attheya_sp.AAC.1
MNQSIPEPEGLVMSGYILKEFGGFQEDPKDLDPFQTGQSHGNSGTGDQSPSMENKSVGEPNKSQRTCHATTHAMVKDEMHGTPRCLGCSNPPPIETQSQTPNTLHVLNGLDKTYGTVMLMAPTQVRLPSTT